MEATGQIEFLATDSSDGTRITVGFPTCLKEAHISEEVILSYEWLSQFKVEIIPWRHGLVALVNGRKSWVPGTKDARPMVSFASGEPQINTLSNGQPAMPQKEGLGFVFGLGECAPNIAATWF